MCSIVYVLILGYARIIFAFISFYFMSNNNYILASVFYLVSGFLDEFDGCAARHFDQGSQVCHLHYVWLLGVLIVLSLVTSPLSS